MLKRKKMSAFGVSAAIPVSQAFKRDIKTQHARLTAVLAGKSKAMAYKGSKQACGGIGSPEIRPVGRLRWQSLLRCRPWQM